MKRNVHMQMMVISFEGLEKKFAINKSESIFLVPIESQ